jgi:hypothetical protein
MRRIKETIDMYIGSSTGMREQLTRQQSWSCTKASWAVDILIYARVQRASDITHIGTGIEHRRRVRW